jgi:hypothetical protein
VVGAADKAPGDALVIKPGDRDKPFPTKAAAKPAAEPMPTLVKGDRNAGQVWNDAIEKGLFKPRQVIAVADVLAICERFDEVVALLKADLRQGVLAQPCVFDALALALQSSGGSSEEIERVRLSAIDLQPKNPQAYLSAAKALNELGHTELAVALCKRAANLEPNAADAYADSLVYMAKAKDVDSDAVQWAASNLLRRDWASSQSPYQEQARQAIQDVIAKLNAAGKKSEADRLAAAIHGDNQRDLVIELVWSDPADLDLEIHEPTGAVCSPTAPLSTGGGVWRGDYAMAKDRAQAYRESYIAGEAFSGSYEIRARIVWGKPMGGKATIRVTRHQGTPNQATELHRVEFDANGAANLKIRLDDGRRTEMTSVPNTPRRAEKAAVARSDRVFNMLRSMSEPAFVASNKKPMTGGASANGELPSQLMDVSPDIGPEVVHQNKLANSHSTGTEFQGQAVIASDRKSIKWSMSPVFQTASSDPEVKLSAIPGGK